LVEEMDIHSPEVPRGRQRECAQLDRLLDGVRSGEGRTLVLRGEPGIGKTVLLAYLHGRASGCRVVRAAGVQSEMELDFAALHQLCAPLLDGLERLPAPQREALSTAFGLSHGVAQDRMLVGLAVLSLLSEAADEQPLVCLVDDAQRLDRVSAQALAFAARRLDAESVGVVFAARRHSDELDGLPELLVEGLRECDARALLESVPMGPLDARVRERIVSEARGNPLALLGLPRAATPAELAGGFACPAGVPFSTSIEDSFRRRLDALPADTRRLLRLVAADPVGEPLLVSRAAEQLAIGIDAATPAVEAGLIEYGAPVRFRHPLVRSAAYRSASVQERRDVHRALAAATDPEIDPDRRAWHRAEAASGADEDVARELERSAGRAEARGGLAAAAAFRERAAMLTHEATTRAQRLLAAAKAKRDAGALDAALGLLVTLEGGPLDALRAAEVEHLRGRIAFDRRRGRDAAGLLLSAARRLKPVDADSSREAHLEALVATLWVGDLDAPGIMREAVEAARAASPAPDPPRAIDVLLDGFALRLTEGYASAAPTLGRAVKLLVRLNARTDEASRWLWLTGGSAGAGALAADELWDADSWHALAARQTQFARDAGALVHLQIALDLLAMSHLVGGDVSTAALMVEEDRLIAEATGNAPVAFTAKVLAAWRGWENATLELVKDGLEDATRRGHGMISCANYARSVLYNGLGRHDAARDAAWQAFERDHLGLGPYVVPELAEAASRTGDEALVRAALEWLSERTCVTRTDWALGIEARVRALLSEGDAADSLYRESIDRFRRTRLRVEFARAHLLYGEWLRRERRRVDAREHLRAAHEMLAGMGIGAFAERAKRELAATGETTRKRTDDTRDGLTPQEAHIARLARDGLSNPEIGTRLFISPRTVEYHLHKVFAKLDISSRAELAHIARRR
jgi:DNA-binding CsgD family transcriptional regulator